MATCNSDTPNTSGGDITEKDPEVLIEDAKTVQENTILLAIVDNLRIRDKPNKTAEILGEMDFGEEATYLGEATPTKEKITLREKERNAPWKKVSFVTKENKVIAGWIYAGGLMNKSELYQPHQGDQYVRKIERFTAKELRTCLKIEC